jgi:hypothetical protein
MFPTLQTLTSTCLLKIGLSLVHCSVLLFLRCLGSPTRLFRHKPHNNPLLLIYRDEPCVVIGRNQNPWKEINMPLLRDLRVPFIRRRSGGGTVYHVTSAWNFSSKNTTDYTLGPWKYELFDPPSSRNVRQKQISSSCPSSCEIVGNR